MTLRLKEAVNNFKDNQPVVSIEDCKIMLYPNFSSINIDESVSALNLLCEKAFELKQSYSNIEKCDNQKKTLIKCQM